MRGEPPHLEGPSDAPGRLTSYPTSGKVQYHSKRGNIYQKMLRFTLDDKKDRVFRVERWCFIGSIDRWIDLWESGSAGKLSDLVKRFCPHIGQESFFELM